MSLLTIEGEVKYIEIEQGFWGIVTEDGKKYLPLNMPQQLKEAGAHVTVTARQKSQTATVHMWGTPVEIISFRTRFGPV